jgi:hypothetical protein
LHFGGSVNEQFELVGTKPHVLTFEKPPSFNDLVARVRIVMNAGCDVRLQRRYDMGGNKPIYVMLHIDVSSSDIWSMIGGNASRRDQSQMNMRHEV